MYKTYSVTITPQHPAWDEVDGVTVEISAPSKKAAIAGARRWNRDTMYFDRHSGRLTYRAAEA